MKKIVVRSTIDVVEHLVNVPGILEGIGLELCTKYSMRFAELEVQKFFTITRLGVYVGFFSPVLINRLTYF